MKTFTMTPGIFGFDGEYRFLSNFWPVTVVLEGKEYPSTEHAYQAAKTLDEDERTQIREAKTPGQAKKLGQGVTMRPDWDEVKYGVMLDLNKQKFKPDTKLGNQLRDTGDLYIEETNYWGDFYWGVCKGIGENNLGKILMQIRENNKAA